MPKKTKKRGKPVWKPKVTTDGTINNASTPIGINGDQYLDPPVKSDVDDNNYRVIKLANGLTAVLVSYTDSSETSQSITTNEAEGSDRLRRGGGDRFSVCEMESPGWYENMMDRKRMISKEAYFELCVNVGSYNDPRQVPGASRILSETILKGSKKYCDEEDDFEAWIWQVDGYKSIQDDGEKTVYKFDVQLKDLTEALDRFSQSLISPLLSPIDMNRVRDELLAEYEKNLLDEEKMMAAEKQNLFKNLASSKHSARVYGSTYLKGLSLPNDDKVYKEVLKFRERHYSAHRMTIVLKAELPLETLEEYIKEYFSKVANNGLPLREFTQFNFMNTFDNPKYGRIYKLSSPAESDRKELEFRVKQKSEKIELTWSIPPSQWLYRTKPERYLSWLIAHEGEGSLFSYLRNKKLCSKIASGVGNEEFQDNSIYSLFSLSLTLTDEGRKEYKNVLDAIFSYINFLRREGPQPDIYDEIRQIEESRFRYFRRGFDEDDVKRLSVHMHLYPPADYLTGKHLYFDYDPVSITTCMNLMSPERANIILYEKTSKRILSEFPSDEIPDEWLENWKTAIPLLDFKLPEPNAFRAVDFTLIPVTESTPRIPVKIHSDDQSEIWYGISNHFRSPLCFFHLFYISPLPMESPENDVMTDMLVKVLKNMTKKELYPARAAGFTFQFERWHKEGIIMHIDGFSEKLPLLMESVAKIIRNSSNLLTEDLFEDAKKKLLAAYEDRILGGSATDTFTEDLRLSILKVVHWTNMDKHAALSDLKFHQLQQFANQFTDHVYVKCLAQGNMTSADVITNVQKFIETSKCGPLLPDKMPQLRKNEIPTGSHYCRVQSFAKEVVVKNYYQCGGYSIRAILMVDLLMSIIEDDVFEELRQIKDIEFFEYNTSFMFHDRGVVGYTIEMSEDYGDDEDDEDDEEDPERLDLEIEVLRRTLRTLFQEMTDYEWRGVMNVFMDQKKLPVGSGNLESEASRNWNEIVNGTYVFDRVEQELIALKKLKIEDVRKWMAYLTTNGNNLRKLSIQAIGDKSRKPDLTSNRKYRLKYLPVTVSGGMLCKHHGYINSIPQFKRGLKVLPIPEKL